MISARSAQSLTFLNSLVAGPAIRTLSARSDLDVIVGAFPGPCLPCEAGTPRMED